MLINVSLARSFRECRRKAWHELFPPKDLIIEADAYDLLIQQMGNEHERLIYESLNDVHTAHGAQHTQDLMAQGVPVIYQAEYIDEHLGLIGKPDFMIRQDDGNYQVYDAKLASSLKNHDEVLIQLELYRRLSGSNLPAMVYLGDGSIAEVPDKAVEKADQFLAGVNAMLQENVLPEAHFGYSKCGVCAYSDWCIPGFKKDENLGLVYGIDSRNIGHLVDQGICTASDLASIEPDAVPEVPYLKKADARRRAGLQARSLQSGDCYRLTNETLPDGIWIHFDIENNPLARHGNEVYLWGFLEPPYGDAAYRAIWSDGGYDNDRQAWVECLDLIADYKDSYPDLVLAHYGHHERTTIDKCAEEYDMMDHPIVQWLLGDNSPLFDMNRFLVRHWVLPVVGYGLKPVCKDERLVNFQWELKESGSQWSIVRYLDFLNADKPVHSTIKDEIVTYNTDDVKATRALEVWIRGLEKTYVPV